ncbi:hypothetical protein EYF80_050109 [Liparis tanakae]|uniref:Uncharacterized protein n=1 Tax=Liparis tanakae TaxID=230148 RepID=A0A4Z2FG39_9TELE|nr:hypothetical protein EYF80_050109 [Liparis tanakae]
MRSAVPPTGDAWRGTRKPCEEGGNEETILFVLHLISGIFAKVNPKKITSEHEALVQYWSGAVKTLKSTLTSHQAFFSAESLSAEALIQSQGKKDVGKDFNAVVNNTIN